MASGRTRPPRLLRRVNEVDEVEYRGHRRSHRDISTQNCQCCLHMISCVRSELPRTRPIHNKGLLDCFDSRDIRVQSDIEYPSHVHHVVEDLNSKLCFVF